MSNLTVLLADVSFAESEALYDLKKNTQNIAVETVFLAARWVASTSPSIIVHADLDVTTPLEGKVVIKLSNAKQLEPELANAFKAVVESSYSKGPIVKAHVKPADD